MSKQGFLKKITAICLAIIMLIPTNVLADASWDVKSETTFGELLPKETTQGQLANVAESTNGEIGETFFEAFSISPDKKEDKMPDEVSVSPAQKSAASAGVGKDLENSSAILYPEASNKTVYYTVKFKFKNGSADQKIKVASGKAVSKPKDPALKGYIFAGWYNGSTKYNFAKKVKSNLVLVAKWQRVTVKTPKLIKFVHKSYARTRAEWKKVSGADGYEVQFAEDASFMHGLKVFSGRSYTKVCHNCITGRTYYARVRAYKNDSTGARVYSSFSSTKKRLVTNGLSIVSADKNAAFMTGCYISGSDKVTVSVSLAGKYVNSSNGKYYIFSVPSYVKTIDNATIPAASVDKQEFFSVSVPLDNGKESSRLHNKFVVAVLKGGSYTIISRPQFITNPEAVAKYRYAFPTASTKKGLQVNTDYLSDVQALGVKHAAVNFRIDEIIARASQRNDAKGVSFVYKGKKYWYDRDKIGYYDNVLGKMRDQHIVVSAILLLGWRDDLTYLIAPKSRERGHTLYGLNTSAKTARNELEAFFTFLAQRYCVDGSIANWVVGNEVNNYYEWNYSGYSDLPTAAVAYARAFRMVSTAIRSVYANARIYISLDHKWNLSTASSFGAKEFLDQFAYQLEKEGRINFNIAYHPYPSPDTSAAFWDNANGYLTSALNSPVVNFGNIGLLTNYVMSKYGTSTRIIFSEQGFTSVRNNVDDQATQAAAIAYAYYLTEFNGMVDAFILHRHIDNKTETAKGLYLGLWTTDNSSSSYEKPLAKKYSYNVFRTMDTKSAVNTTSFALNMFGVGGWKQLVPGFSWSRFPN